MNFKINVVLLTIFAFIFNSKSFSQYNLVVAQDGSGDYTTVQAAINAAPAAQTAPYVIYIKNGTYREKINIPSTKPFLQLVGENVAKVILTYDDFAAKLVTCSTTIGTQNSASFTVNANDFSAFNITFQNNYGDGSQAVAITVNADRSVFKNCRFLANQDTVYLKGSGNPKSYFNNCYIDGNIDFIFGSSIALFDSCVVYAKTRSTITSSYITAPNTPNGQAYGFVFRDTRFPGNTGTTSYYLSRPWPSPDVASTRQKVSLLSCRLSSHIKPEGWSIWDANTVTTNLFNAEYNSRYFSGASVDVSTRAAWSLQLNQADSATYTLANLFGAWNPCAVYPSSCTPQSTSLAVSNFSVIKGAVNSQFFWNISWPVSGIHYELFRSADNINFSSVYSTTEPTDSMVNFSFTDPVLPAAGSRFYYYLTASKAGHISHTTDTLQVSNAESLVVNASATLNLCGISQELGTPSAAQTYTISGTNLTGNVNINAPNSFEVSADNLNWYPSGTPLILFPSAGVLNTTTIYVRLNASAIGNYSGSVINASTGVSDIPVLVTGVVFPVSTSFLLQQWPLTTDNHDSAAVRSYAVTPSTSLVNSSINKLYTSDGTQPAASPIPAYSGTFGQALGANPAGNSWSNVGGTLKRDYYEQFTVTAATGYNVRIDSVAFLSDFYLTISNIKMALVYSRNGFGSPADSTEFLNGMGPGNTMLTLTSSGTFSKSFPLLRNDAGPLNRYALSLNGTAGITLNAGQTLTIRLYWACGSSSTPRFAFLKNVMVKGVVLNPVPAQLLDFKAVLKNNNTELNWETVNEQNMKSFELERSMDGKSFSVINTQNALNSLYNNYHYTDPLFISGYYNYRIKMIGNDNGIKYSELRNIIFSNLRQLTIMPNPARNEACIYFAPSDEEGWISLFNIQGKLIQTCKIKKGESFKKLYLYGVPAGIYQISIKTASDFTSGKLMVY